MDGTTRKTNNQTKEQKKMNTETMKELETLRQQYHEGDQMAKYKIFEIVNALVKTEFAPEPMSSAKALTSFFKHSNS
jgi:hypothetical protein